MIRIMVWHLHIKLCVSWERRITQKLHWNKKRKVELNTLDFNEFEFRNTVFYIKSQWGFQLTTKTVAGLIIISCLIIRKQRVFYRISIFVIILHLQSWRQSLNWTFANFWGSMHFVAVLKHLSGSRLLYSAREGRNVVLALLFPQIIHDTMNNRSWLWDV